MGKAGNKSYSPRRTNFWLPHTYYIFYVSPKLEGKDKYKSKIDSKRDKRFVLDISVRGHLEMWLRKGLLLRDRRSS